MDQDILKLLPQKAFKLLSVKETFRVGKMVTKSLLDKDSQVTNFKARKSHWKFNDIELIENNHTLKDGQLDKADGERILKIYFSQFFEKDLPVHIDLRKSSFKKEDILYWTPSKLSYRFSSQFLYGVCALYLGFYNDNVESFDSGLLKLNIANESMNSEQKKEIRELFYSHFGEGRNAPVQFSLAKLQDSFNTIFSHFLKNDIPLNPEFAVLGINLVTLYLTLQEIPEELDVSKVFKEITEQYS